MSRRFLHQWWQRALLQVCLSSPPLFSISLLMIHFFVLMECLMNCLQEAGSNNVQFCSCWFNCSNGSFVGACPQFHYLSRLLFRGWRNTQFSGFLLFLLQGVEVLECCGQVESNRCFLSPRWALQVLWIFPSHYCSIFILQGNINDMVSLSQIVTTENGIQEEILLVLSYYLSYLIDNTKLSV